MVDMSVTVVECAECRATFEISPSERDWFAAHEMTMPKRCRECRRARRAPPPCMVLGSDDVYPRLRWDAVCAKCGKTDRVPFKPHPSRPVFCGACYAQIKADPKPQDQ